MRPVRRVLWRSGLALLAVTLALLVLVGVATLYLTSSAGERLVKQLALKHANAQLAGRLDFEKLELATDRVVLENLKLFDPEGQLVAEVRRVELDLDVSMLSPSNVHIESAKVLEPRLYLASDERGLNLSRAVEPRAPPSDAPATGEPPNVRVQLDAFELASGHVDFRSEGRWTAESLNARGNALWVGRTGELSAALRLDGRMTAPASAPLSVSAEIAGRADALSAKLAAALAQAKLSAQAETKGTGAVVRLDGLELPPDAARVLAPNWPLRVGISASGTLSKDGDVLAARLFVSAGKARLAADGSFDLARLVSDGVALEASGVDLAELLGGDVPTELSAKATLRGGGANLASLNGEASLDVSPSRVRGQPIGPVRLRATAKDGQYQLSELFAALPGLRLWATGAGDASRLRIAGKLTAADLAATSRALGAVVDGAPRLGGSGALDVALDGRLTGPGLFISGGFARLSIDDARLEGLEVNASLPDVRRPLEAQGRLHAHRVTVGDRPFEDVRVQLVTQGRRLGAELSTKGLANIVVRAGGTLDASGEALALESLSIDYPEASWALQSPSRIVWANGDVEVAPVKIASGRQSLAAAFASSGRTVRGSLTVEALDLRKLPGAFVNPQLQLRGLVDASARLEGRASGPEGALSLSWRDAGVRKLGGIDGKLEATYRKDRATGQLRIDSAAGSAHGRFDTPVMGLLEQRAEPMQLSLELNQVNAGAVLWELELPFRAEGKLSAQLTVEGMANAPRLRVRVDGADVRLPTTEEKQLHLATLVAELTNPNEHLELRADASALSGTIALAASVPLTVSRLLTSPPTEAQLRALPLSIEAMVSGVELAAASEAGLSPEGVSGRVGAHLLGRGTLFRPEGTFELELVSARTGALSPTDVKLRAAATESLVRLELTARRKNQLVASAEGRVHVPVESLADLTALEDAPVSIDATVGPLPLVELTGTEGTRDSLSGLLSLRLTASGTPSKPTVAVKGGIDRLGFSKAALGRAELDAQYADGRTVANLSMTSPAGGRLAASGELALELGLGALRRGLAYEEAPFQARVDAEQFDLRCLSGIHPDVRLVEGHLTAALRGQGTLRKGELTGTAEWKNGRLGLLGFGEYRDIHLLARATTTEVEVKDLSLKAGGGAARLTASARRAGQRWSLNASAETAKLPIIYDDQLMATATMRAFATGDFGGELVDIRALAIPEAHIELPAVKQKDLQELDRPPDIVLVRKGQPVEKRRRAPAQKEAPAQARVHQSDGGTRYRVVLNARNNLWVKSTDLNVELGFGEGFRIEYDDKTQMMGDLRILRGKVDVIGRKFEIQRDAQVTFQGPPTQPFVNLTATHVNEREGVTIFVTLTGSGKDLKHKVWSQPPMGDTEIYTLLATGRRTLKRGSGAAMTGAQAASVLGSVMASQLKTMLSNKLPLDVVSVEAGDEGLAGARLELGTYLSDDLYVGYTGQVGADPAKGENAHTGKVEYRIGRRWSLEAAYGDGRAGGADIVWSREY